jgi:hypothetical protein
MGSLPVAAAIPRSAGIDDKPEKLEERGSEGQYSSVMENRGKGEPGLTIRSQSERGNGICWATLQRRWRTSVRRYLRHIPTRSGRRSEWSSVKRTPCQGQQMVEADQRTRAYRLRGHGNDRGHAEQCPGTDDTEVDETKRSELIARVLTPLDPILTSTFFRTSLKRWR